MLDNFYEVCPEQCRRYYVVKDYKKVWAQTVGGTDVHKVIDSRIKNGVVLPPDAAAAEPFIAAMEARGPINSEVSLAVDRHIRPTDFWENQPAKIPWLRGKFDVVQRAADKISVFLGDWKTGKIRESPDQVEIGALLIMEKDPSVQTVTGANIWLKEKKLGTPYVFRREEKGERWAKWIGKMKAIEALDPSKVWERRESGLCGWCEVLDCPNNNKNKMGF